jgi:hypothetical protein
VQHLLSSGFLPKKYKIKINRTLILPIVLYECENCSLILREEHMLRVFENRVLRKIFGSKRDKTMGERRRLLNEERYDLYSSSNIIRVIKSRRMNWASHVTRMGERRGAYTGFMEEPAGRRTLG